MIQASDPLTLWVVDSFFTTWPCLFFPPEASNSPCLRYHILHIYFNLGDFLFISRLVHNTARSHILLISSENTKSYPWNFVLFCCDMFSTCTGKNLFFFLFPRYGSAHGVQNYRLGYYWDSILSPFSFFLFHVLLLARASIFSRHISSLPGFETTTASSRGCPPRWNEDLNMS